MSKAKRKNILNSGPVKMVMFDYGGVIAPEGFQLGILKMAQKFDISFEEMYEIAGNKAGRHSGYTAGKVGEDVYWKKIAALLDVDKDLSFCREFFLDNFQPRSDMLELIRNLSKNYKLGLFSDQTNWIYELNKKYDFMRFFNYLCISFDKGLTKHDDGFYLLPPKEMALEPGEILLIDDKPRVIHKAATHAMKAELFTTVARCRNFFRDVAI